MALDSLIKTSFRPEANDAFKSGTMESSPPGQFNRQPDLLNHQRGASLPDAVPRAPLQLLPPSAALDSRYDLKTRLRIAAWNMT